MLKDLCAELFDHIFSTEQETDKNNLFHCDMHDSVFLHLFKHIKKNDNNICRLLASKNNDLFLEYFKTGVRGLIVKRIADFEDRKPALLPEDFWVNHVTATFIETLRWWIENKMKQSPETITQYFLLSIELGNATIAHFLAPVDKKINSPQEKCKICLTFPFL